jgi:hypothetical protein
MGNATATRHYVPSSVGQRGILDVSEPEPPAEADRGRRPGFPSFNVLAGGPGSLTLALAVSDPTWVITMSNATEIETLLAPYPPEVRDLALAARDFMAQTLPGASETIDGTAKLFGYGYGPGYKGLVCTLLLSKTGIKIGISRGSELPDPKKLMHGSGKVHRHVQLRAIEDLKQPGLKPLLKAALAAWKKRNENDG